MKNKSVWIVEDGAYSDYKIYGIFSSYSKALLVAEAMGLNKSHVEERELNPCFSELSKDYHLYSVIMLRNGDVERVDMENVTDLTGTTFQVWGRSQTTWGKKHNLPDCLQCRVWARNRKHAIKITGEIRTRVIADGKWPVKWNA